MTTIVLVNKFSAQKSNVTGVTVNLATRSSSQNGHMHMHTNQFASSFL